jgi:hypothetical protein
LANLAQNDARGDLAMHAQWTYKENGVLLGACYAAFRNMQRIG